MKTILVPLDGSELASTIVPHVHMLASNLSANVLMVHVVEKVYQYQPVEHQYIPYGQSEPMFFDSNVRQTDVFEYSRRNAESYLHQMAAPLRKAGLEVAIDVHFGSPATCITEIARNRPVDLIAMTTGSTGSLRRWALGSTTQKVIHATDIPVYVVHAHQELPAGILPQIKRILVPLDGSTFSAHVLPLAKELATHMHAEVLLLHALLPPDELPALVRVNTSETIFRDIWAQRRKQAEHMLSAVKGKLREESIPSNFHVFSGYPPDVIVEEATLQHCDLIVMATHGFSGLRRWMLGSVADKVLRACNVPLLLVHAQESAN